MVEYYSKNKKLLSKIFNAYLKKNKNTYTN